MARGIPFTPPRGLMARSAVIDGEEVVIFSYPVDGAPPEPQALTPAEAEVARLLLAGNSNAEIASARQVTPSTVAKQVERVFRRFGVHSRAEFAAHPWARRYR